MRRLSRIRRLSRSDIRLHIGSLFLVAVIRMGLWCLPFRTWRRLLARYTEGRESGRAAPAFAGGGEEAEQVRRRQAERMARAVRRVSHLVPCASCLTQALATKVLLNRAGLPSHLHIGVAKGISNKLEAHAWIEYENRVIIGGRVSRYSRLLVLEEIL